jgi:hypothetical protein
MTVMKRSSEVALDGRRHPALGVASAGVLALEVAGSLAMWAPFPLAWLWVGARAYEATGRITIGGGVALLGILATTLLTLAVLGRIDRLWITLRRRAGHDQPQGALTNVVVISATVAIALFMIWNFLNKAFIMPFMPNG